jgi:hypothetical protein
MRMLLCVAQIRLIKLTLLRLNPSSTADYDQRLSSSVVELKFMAENMASSVPFSLERFKVINSCSPTENPSIVLSTDKDTKPYLASLAAWPVSIAASLEEIGPQFQMWFKSELAILGTITGDAILAGVEDQRWATL